MVKLSKPVATLDTLKRLVSNSDSKYATKASLSTVATTGSYKDLSNTPTSLTNPYALTFTDGNTSVYDGSAAVSVSIPTSLPANGGNAATVNKHTVLSDVPANAKFTDTVYSLPNATATTLGGVKIGSNITLATDTISISKANVIAALGYTPSGTDTTYNDMVPATADAAGAHGLVPAPGVGANNSFLRGDGIWAIPTDTDTHYTTGLKVAASATGTANAAATNGNVYLNVLDNSTVRDFHKIIGSGATTVTSDTNGVITINSTNTVYTHPSSGVTAGTYKSVTVNAQGHVTAGSNPTTLAGYGISDAKIANGVITLGSNTITPLTAHQSLTNYYTKTEVDNKVSAIPKFAIAVVESLPTSNISTTTVYLKKTGSDTQNLYTEYIYVNSAWEQLGTQAVDLTGYLTKTDAASTYLGKTANAASATKATQDASGNVITSTYLKGLSVSGKVITYTKGDGTTGTITTQDTNTTYSKGTATYLGLTKPSKSYTNAATLTTAAASDSTNKPTINAITTTSSRYYAVEQDVNGVPFVNVPWTNTNTTYSAGTGISFSGTTINNSGVRSITAGSSANLLSVNTGGTTTTITINNVANATTATKVGSATVGSASAPVYINAGTPTACTSISMATVTATTTLNIPGGKIWIE